VLGWRVLDIVATIRALREAGVAFKRYERMAQDEDGVWIAPGRFARRVVRRSRRQCPVTSTAVHGLSDLQQPAVLAQTRSSWVTWLRLPPVSATASGMLVAPEPTGQRQADVLADRPPRGGAPPGLGSHGGGALTQFTRLT
jgi:hypothetical protein